MSKKGRKPYTLVSAEIVVVFALLLVMVSILPNINQLSVPALMSKPVQLSSANFPDSAFRDYIADHVDLDADGYLSNEEVAAVKTLGSYDSNYKVHDAGLSGLGIVSLEGIDTFYNLESLVAADNQISDLDLSGNPSLRYLDMRNNPSFSISYTTRNAGAQLLVSDNYKSAGDVSELDIVEVP